MILGNFVKWQGSIARNIGWLTNFSPINAHDKSTGSYLTQKRNGLSNYASEYAFEHSVSMKKTLLGWHFQLMKCTLRMFYVAFSAHNLKFRSVQPFLLLLKWNKWAKNKITNRTLEYGFYFNDQQYFTLKHLFLQINRWGNYAILWK